MCRVRPVMVCVLLLTLGFTGCARRSEKAEPGSFLFDNHEFYGSRYISENKSYLDGSVFVVPNMDAELLSWSVEVRRAVIPFLISIPAITWNQGMISSSLR